MQNYLSEQTLSKKSSLKSNGAALITALLVTTIAAALAVLIFSRQQILIQETKLITNYCRLNLFIKGAELWAVAAIKDSTKHKLQNPDKYFEQFPKTMPTSTYQGATINATLSDQTALININSLADINNQQIFVRLVTIVVNKISKEQAEQLAKNVTNWLIPSNDDTIYTQKKPPYLAAHRLMINKSELRLIDGISANIYRKIEPYITVLPTTTNIINVNNASPTVLASIADISPSQANAIVMCHNNNEYFHNLDEFYNCLRELGINQKVINILITTFSSNYFLLTTTAKLGNQELIQKTSMERLPATKEKITTIKILWQSNNS